MCWTELCLVIVGVVAVASPVAPSFLGNDDTGLYLDKSIQLLQERCPKRVINQRIFNDIPACLVENLANSPQMKSILEAAQAENWDVYFRNVCKMFPNGKRCLRPVADLIDDCTFEGYKFNAVIDSVEDFFCASFAPGTLKCLVAHGQEVRTCIRYNSEMIQTQLENTEGLNQEAFCEAFNMMTKCKDQVLLKCNDPNLEDRVSSLTRTLSEAFKCSEPRSGAAYKTTSYLLLFSSILMVGVAAIL